MEGSSFLPQNARMHEKNSNISRNTRDIALIIVMGLLTNFLRLCSRQLIVTQDSRCFCQSCSGMESFAPIPVGFLKVLVLSGR